MNINQSKRNNNKSTEDEPSIKGNVRAQERCREEAGRGSMRESMSLRDISVCLQMAITSQWLICLLLDELAKKLYEIELC